MIRHDNVLGGIKANWIDFEYRLVVSLARSRHLTECSLYFTPHHPLGNCANRSHSRRQAVSIADNTGIKAMAKLIESSTDMVRGVAGREMKLGLG